VRWARLPGASSAAVHRLWLSDGRSVVLRRYVWRGYLEAEPEAPGREVACLRFAAARGLAVPTVIAADLDAEVPVILMSFVAGRAIAVPDLERMAEVAASIHDVAADDLGHDYYPWYADVSVRPPAGSTHPELWERAYEMWQTQMPDYRPVLIHRDFHPGNVLWRRGRASGIVDWASACRGPVGCDVAHCRTNLVNWGDEEAAERFTVAYERLTGVAHHPFWEIAAVMESQRSIAAEPRLGRAMAQLLG
jgi:aminoglycoside/choline kinase family phosphotransferase